MNLYLNLPVIASFVCKNTHSMYSHKHSAMTMNNILTSGGFNTMSFSIICVFRKYINMKGRLVINKMQLQISYLLSVLNFFVPWQVVYKYCDKSFINKPTFLNFVPQLIKKISGRSWFCRFRCMIVAQAHISLMTRLLDLVTSFPNYQNTSMLWFYFY